MTNHEKSSARRPLKVRDVGMAQKTAAWLANKNVQPNHISLFSIAFGIAALLCLLAFAKADASVMFAILTAVMIQGRLLCNLFDGMVAVEGGKSTPSGELFNDIPDRIVDPLVLIGLGYAATQFPFNATLGWAAAVLAVFTAYVRTLSASIGAPVDFSGPMAKQHRMALTTIACVAVALEASLLGSRWSLSIALWCIVAGSAITVARRTVNAYRFLETAQQPQSQQDA